MLNKIRKHSKIMIWLFAFVSIAFIAEEGIIYFLRYRDKNKDFKDGDILVVGGERVKFSEFKRRYDNKMSYYSSRFGITKNDTFWGRYIKNNLVNEIIEEIAFKKMAKNIGMKVGSDELVDLVQGENMNADIKQSFTNKDGIFEKEKLLEFLNKMSKKKELRDYWCESEQQLCDVRNKEKLNKIFDSMHIYNKLDFDEDWKKEKAKFDIEYLYVPYSSIEDDSCEVTDSQKKEYFDQHKRDFHTDEFYRIKYFIVEYKLSEDDKRNNLNSLQTLKTKFQNSKNSLEFAQIKSDKDLDRHSKDENNLKCSHKDLPKVIAQAEECKEGDTFIEIADTVKGQNKIYKIEKINNKDKTEEEKDYEISVIFKKPFVNSISKQQLLEKLKQKMLLVYSADDFEEFAKEIDAKVKKKDAKLDETNIDDVDDVRKLIHDIMEKYKIDDKEKVFKINVFNNENACFCGIVEKHVLEGYKDIKDIDEDLKLKCIKQIKFDKIMKKIKDAGINDLSFDEIKNKKIDFIKFGEEKDIAFDKKFFKGYGRTKFGTNNIFLLKEGENTKFFDDESGVLMVKVKKITCETFDKNIEDHKKFFDDKEEKEKRDIKFDKIFEQRFSVENNKNIFL